MAAIILAATDAAAQTVTLSVPENAFLTEGEGSRDIPVTAALSATRATPTTITLSLGGTARATDYTVQSLPSITIPARSTVAQETLVLAPVDDGFFEQTETIAVNGAADGLTVNGTAFDLQDNDEQPDLAVAVPELTRLDEGEEKDITFTVRLHDGGLLEDPVAVSISAVYGSPTTDGDFAIEPPGPWSVTIPANTVSASVTVTISVADDMEAEGVEVIRFQARADVFADVVLDTPLSHRAIVLISSNDQLPRVQVQFNPESLPPDVSTEVEVTATVSPPAPEDFTLTLSLNDDWFAPYLSTTTLVLEFAKGDMLATSDLTVTPPAELSSRPVRFLSIPNVDTVRSSSTLVSFYVHSSGPPQPTGSRSFTSRGGDDGVFHRGERINITTGFSRPFRIIGRATYRIVLDSGVVEAQCFQSTPRGLWCTHSVADGDYDFDGMVVFNAGALTFEGWHDPDDPTITWDLPVEPPERRSWGIDPVYGGDNAIDLRVSPQSLQEGAGATPLEIIAQDVTGLPRTEELEVPLRISAGTAGASDYVVSGALTVTIPAGAVEGRTTVMFTPVDDGVTESRIETVRIEGDMEGAPANFVRGVDFRIIDAANVVLSVSPGSVDEAGGAQEVTVTAALGDAGDAVQPRAIPVALTWGGTAGPGDYTVVGALVTIPANARSGTQTVTITPTDDRLLEGDETITLRGSTPGRTVVGTELTLADDEDVPAVALAVTLDALLESGGERTATVSATLDPDVAMATDETTVELALSGTATLGTDYTRTWSPASPRILIPNGMTEGSNTVTLTLTPHDDAVAEDDEAITVEGTATTGSRDLVVKVATIILQDDDTAGVVVEPTRLAIDEGEDGAYTVGLTSQPVGEVTVSVAVPADAPLTAQPTELRFQPDDWSSRQEVTVSVAADDDAVTNEDVVLTHTVAGGGYEGVTALPVTVTPLETTVPELTVADAAAAEDAGRAVFDVELDVPSSNEVTASWTTADASATAGADYTASSGTVSFPPGTTYRVVQVPVLVDDLDEDDETFTVTLSDALHAALADGEATGTITDDDAEPALTLSGPAAPAREGEDASLAFTVTLAPVSGREVTVGYATADGTAAAPGDYAETNGTLTFAAGETTKTITVPVVDDEVDEPDETFTLMLSGPVNATLAAAEATGTITDDEVTPTVTLALAPSSISEDGGESTVTAMLSGASSEATTVTVSAAAVTPAESDDFELSTNTELTIAAGQTASTGTVTITAVNDDVDGPDKEVTVSAAATNTQGVDGPADVTLTITDDEGTPTVTLVLGPASIGENGASSTVTARLSGESSEATTITVSAAAVTPAESDDFELSTNTELTIAAGQTASTGTVTITAVNDDVDGPDKEVTVSAAATNTQGVDGPADVTLTITDDEGTPTVTLVLGPASIGENGASSTVTARLSGESSEATTITVSAAAVTPAESDDFELSTNTELTIAAGQTASTGTVTITAVNDDVDGPDKEVTVSAAATNTQGVDGPADVTLTITDDEGAPAVTLVLSPASIGENGASSTVTARLSGESSEATTITVSAAAVTPAESDDFELSTNTELTIAAGQTASTGTVTITAVNDDVDGPDKEVTVSAAATNTQGVDGPADVTLTITDDEGTPTVTLVLGPASIGENGASSTVTARLSGESSEATTITVSAAAVTPAESDDFELSTNTELTIAAGQTESTGTVTITAVNDDVDGPDKEVTVSATAANDQGVDGPDAVTLTITDDEGTPAVTLVLSPASIGENGASSTVTARLSGESSEATTITVSAAAVTPAESDDFELSTNTELTIAAGQTESTGTVTITAVDDDVDGPDNEVTVSAAATNTQGVDGPADVTLTITDDEGTPTVTLVLGPASIGENGASSTVTAMLSGESSEATTITVAAAAVTPAESDDFELSTNTELTIAAGQTESTGTVTITAVNDDVDGPDKEVTVSAAATNTQGVDGPDAVTLTITDDEGTPTVTLVLSPASIGENGASSTVTARLSGESSEATTITVSAAAVTPAESDDFELSTNTELTIAAGQTESTGTVTITAVDNDVDGPDKEVTVSAAAANDQGVDGPDAVTLTITDDEGTPAVTLVLSPASIGENGASSTVTARLSGESSEATTITVSAAAVTPAESDDFELSTNTELTIAAGQTASTGTVTITAVNDDVDGPDKEVTVSAAATNTQGVDGPADVTLTITDDEGTPTVTLVLGPASIGENGASSTVTARLSGESSEATTITVSAAAVTPAESDDFELSTNTELTIAAGQTASTGTVTITAVNDDVDGPDKEVTVSAAATNTQGVDGPADVTLTITDDEGTPTVTLVLGPASIGENGASSTVTARLSGESSEATTITVSAAAVTPAESDDFELSTNTELTIAAGQTASTGTVTITAVNDDVDGPDKEVTVSAAATNTQGVDGPADVTLTITDDEGTPTVTLVLGPASIGENGASSTVTARLSGESSEATTITVSAAAVTPAESDDFELSTNTELTIAAGQTASTGTVTITAVNDDVDGPDKEVTVSAAATNTQGVDGPADVTLTITDDEGTPTVTLVLGPASIGENGASSTVTARLSGESSEATTITVSAAAVTPAESDDFELSTNTELTIAAGQTESTGTVTITAVDNDVDGPDKEVTVSATAANDQGVDGPADVTLTITDDEGTPAVTLVLSPASIGENGASSTVTAMLSGESSEATTITVSAAAVTPAESDDFELSTNTELTIAAGQTASTGTVTITAVNDDVDGPDKEVTVSAAATNTQGVSAPAAVTLTITDDEGAPTVTLALAPSSISEDGGESTVTAMLSGASSEATTVTVSAAAVSPAVAGDFTQSGTELTIAAGETASTGTVTITAEDNAVDAPNKTVTVSGSASGGHGVEDPAAVTLTITDDEGVPTVTLALAPSSISEDGGESTVTAMLSGASSEATTVTVSAAAVSPAVAGDFTQSGTELTIAAGETASTGTVTIAAEDNAVDAPNKTVTVSGSASGGHGVEDPAAVTLTITDDEGAPTVTLVLSPSSISEDGGESTVTAMLSGASNEATTVTVSEAAVSPAVGGDFTQSGTELTIAAGQTASTGTVTITAEDNAVDAPNKTVTVSGSASGGHGVEDPAAVTLTITDDEGAPTVTLVLSPSSISEDGGESTVTAMLSGASNEATTVTVSAAAVSPAVGGDFTQSGTELTIAAGQTASTGTVTITAEDNAVDAPNKTVTVSGSASGGHGVEDPAAVTLTITDDEGVPTVTLALAPSSISEDGGESTVTAMLSGASSEATTVTVSAAAVSPAVAGDFTQSGTELTIAAGETASTGTVTIAAEDNAVDAPNKTVTVSGSASGGHGVEDPAAVTLTITDDEGVPTVTLALAPSSISEDGGESTVTAMLSGASSEATTVTVSAAAVSPAVAGDFTQSGTELTIAAGQTASTGTVTITAEDNAVDAPDKTVTVSGSASGGHGVEDPAAVTLTITDDEGVPTVTLALAPSSISEDGGESTVTAMLSGASSEATTVTVSAAAVSPAVAGDFTQSGTELTIAAGETASTGTVTIAAEDNAVDAPDKTVTVSGSASGGHGVEAPAAVTLTITDDEVTPTVTLALAPSSISEDGGESTVTAMLSGASSEATTVTVSAAAVSPAESDDFELSTNTELTIVAGQTESTGTVTITAVDNDVDGPDKEVTVSAAATNTQGVDGPAAVTLTITDDEGAPTVTLVLGPASIGENGGESTVTAMLSGESSEATTVTVSTSPDSPAVAGDFTQSGTELTIAAGQTASTGTVTITAEDNAVDAPNKTVTVSGSASGGLGVEAPAAVTLTITDDEVTPTVTLVLSPSSISEDGGESTVTAMLSGASSEATTITVSATAVSPALGGDFELSTNTELTIVAGETESAGTVTITAVDNDVDGPDKEVTVSAVAANDQGVDGPEAVTLTISDDEGAPTVTLVLSPASITEDGGESTVTATLSGASGEDTTITVTAAAVTPAVSGDFTQSGTTLTIAAGETASTGTVTITAVDNGMDGPDKEVTVSGSASGGLGVADPEAVTLTISDDEGAPTVTLVLSPASITEDGGESTVTATLSGASGGATTITVTAAAVTPAVSGDFTQSGTTLTIAAGETASTGTVTITAVDNGMDGPDKEVTVSGSASGGLGVADPEAVTLTISDDEGAPTVTLVLSPASITEDGGESTVTATLSGASGGATTITVTAAAVTPAVSGDFTQSGTTLTIAAGQTESTGTVTITAVNDDVDGPDKEVTVSGSASGGLGVADPEAVTLTITDDEVTPTVTLVLSPASITEDGGESTVTARLSGASSEATTITVTAAAVSPAESDDFELSTNTELTIAAGQTESAGTVTITAVDNDVDAPDKEVTVSGSASGGLGVADPEAVTLAITDDDEPTAAPTRVVKPWLARVGRTVAGQVVDAIGTRLARPAGGGSQVTLAGRRLPLDGVDAQATAGAGGGWTHQERDRWPGVEASEPRTVTGRELLLGSSFRMAFAGDDEAAPGTGARWTAWGGASASRFDGRADGLSLDGEATTLTLGADAAWARWLAGVALARSTVRGGFLDHTERDHEGGGTGTLQSTLTSVHPYARYEVREWLTLWGVLGWGLGAVTLVTDGDGDEAGPRWTTDTVVGMGAAGARVVVAAPAATGVELAVRADGLLTHVRSEAGTGAGGSLAATEAGTGRLRLIVEGSRAFEVGAGGTLTPSLELGVRHDGGDAETGTGVEMGAGVRYAGSRVTVEGAVRGLVAHEETGYEEWGASASVRIGPGASGRGASLTLSPVWGAASSGVERLWSANDAAALAPAGAFEAQPRLDAEAGYGLEAFGGRGLMTPYAGLALSEAGDRTWRVGARWRRGADVSFDLEGTRSEPANDAPRHGFALRASLHW